MTSIQIIQGLPFVSVIIEVNQQKIELTNILLDTGSGASVFKTDHLETIDLVLLPDDNIRKMTGIGGDEYVFEKQIDSLRVGDLIATSFTIQLGALEYGMNINGIIGSDFLLKTKAKIDFQNLLISS